jgi:glyoxalase family protein
MSTSANIPGIHHVTAITADAQKNVDFYCGVLGLRLVKLTVNFDDPSSYHLYYGDEIGRPGTILTFFAWAGAYRGRIGPPQVTVTAFAVPVGSLEFWAARLKQNNVAARPAESRFEERGLAFVDPDGMEVEIIEGAAGGQPWGAGPVPVEQAIRGFHSVTISEEGYEKTAKVLSDLMGFKAADSQRNRFRYHAAGAGIGTIVDLLCVPGARSGSMGAGVVHHVAFRTPTDPQQEAWQQKITAAGLNVSPVMDRTYFHSIYYREPGGVLFEIATDSPGFTFDEPAESLGTKLMLPPWLQSQRSAIKRSVQPLKLPVIRGR